MRSVVKAFIECNRSEQFDLNEVCLVNVLIQSGAILTLLNAVRVGVGSFSSPGLLSKADDALVKQTDVRSFTSLISSQ